jgi:hypothetical protein
MRAISPHIKAKPTRASKSIVSHIGTTSESKRYFRSIARLASNVRQEKGRPYQSFVKRSDGS